MCAASIIVKTTFDLKLEVGYFHYAQTWVSFNIRSRLLNLLLKLRLGIGYVHIRQNCGGFFPKVEVLLPR